jgi:ribosomal protein L11 methylase PrmA
MSVRFREPTIPLSKQADNLISDRKTSCEEEEVIDDWGLSTVNFQLFAQHESRTVYLIPSSQNHDKTSSNHSCDSNDVTSARSRLEERSSSLLSFSILCVEALTPIDMIQLGSGIHDATGHCVWMGAFLFLATLKSHLFPFFNETTNETIDALVPEGKSHRTPNSFRRRRVLELGCGTGIGSIGIWAAYNRYHVQENRDTVGGKPWITMTDADPEALDLCRRNCQLNNIPPSSYSVQSLFWGETPLPEPIASVLPYETVFATDVLYDIKLLPPLIKTAHLCLKDLGYFILAHVPRACYDSQHPPVSNLEDYIVQCATSECGFCLERIFRPLDCSNDLFTTFPKDALNSTTLLEMEEVGAAIFVFQKK